MHLERLTMILEIVGQKGEATVAEICAHSDLPKPTAYRLVNDLTEAGLLDPVAKGQFAIGYRLKQITEADQSDQVLLETIAPVLRDAADTHGAAFFLSRLRGKAVEIIAVETPDTGVSFLHPGLGKRPLHACSCSKAVAAFSPTVADTIASRLKAYTEFTHTDRAELAAEFELIRQQWLCRVRRRDRARNVLGGGAARPQLASAHHVDRRDGLRAGVHTCVPQEGRQGTHQHGDRSLRTSRLGRPRADRSIRMTPIHQTRDKAHDASRRLRVRNPDPQSRHTSTPPCDGEPRDSRSTTTCTSRETSATRSRTSGTSSTMRSCATLPSNGRSRSPDQMRPRSRSYSPLATCRMMAVGQCKYILITNAEGGLINDPVLLRLAEDHFWISLADSDVLLWAQGVAINSGMDVTITEPDVSPLQLQGPKSGQVMEALFGETIHDLKYYWLREVELDGIPLIVSRTGWSSELGYELYLRDGSRGDELWEQIMAAGQPFGLKPGHTSSIRRIEGGMLSYHADADIHTNPFELGFDRLVNLDGGTDFIGKAALQRIQDQGVDPQANRARDRW